MVMMMTSMAVQRVSLIPTSLFALLLPLVVLSRVLSPALAMYGRRNKPGLLPSSALLSPCPALS